MAACPHAVSPQSKQVMHVWLEPLAIVTSEDKSFYYRLYYSLTGSLKCFNSSVAGVC